MVKVGGGQNKVRADLQRARSKGELKTVDKGEGEGDKGKSGRKLVEKLS